MSTPSEQLQLLREFVGTTVYTETSLTDCLRQTGYNVERAAELLITGQYRPSSYNNSNSNHQSLNDKKPAAKQHSSCSLDTSTATKRIVSGISSRSTGSSSSKKPTPTTTPANYSYSTAAKASTPRVSLESFAQDNSLYENAWLLAERWISECLCNCRRGSIRYQEVLTLTHSKTGPPIIRFKGASAEGILPPSLAALMVPLLRYPDDDDDEVPAATNHHGTKRAPLLLLRAESLYEDNNLGTGSLVPIRLKLYLPDPKAFFDLFLQDGADDGGGGARATNTSMFFEMRAKKNKKRLPLTQAAFGLLQYAQYGDVPKFEVPVAADGTGADSAAAAAADEADDEEEEVMDEQLDEDDKSEEGNVEAQELDKGVSLTGATAKVLPEANDPPGFAPGISLRPYQRQALYWMRKRETQGNSREEHEEQLELLKELADYVSADSPATPYSPGKENRGHIYCECGPIQVSDQARARSRTVDGQINPISHPLWQQRYLASSSMKETITFYVNEVFGAATHQTPEPPKAAAGGILADSMGLGKTVIVLSLILQEKAERLAQTDMVMLDAPTTTLVVVKLSLVQQWEQEIKSKTNLSVYVYHDCAGAGIIRKTQATDLASVDIVLTTYQVLQGEMKRKQPMLLHFPWLRVVLDEAHTIKNHQTLASKAACDLNTVYRWACTGTIIQNGLEDVFGLMKFLGHEPWCWPSFWKTAITKPWNAGRDEKDDNVRQTTHQENVSLVLTRLRKLLNPMMLRRTKEIVNLELPPVDTQVIRIDFSESERIFYDAVLERSNEIFESFVDKGTAEKSYMQILSMISRLRQTCDHMFLTVRSKIDDEALAEIEEDSSSATGRKIESNKESEALDQSFFQQLLRKVQSVVSPCKKRTEESSDGGPSKRAKDSAYLSQMVEGLTAAVRENSAHVKDECPICLETPLIENAAISPCGHIFCKSCLVQYLRDKATPRDDSKVLYKLIHDVPNGVCPCCNKPIKAKKIVELTKSASDDGGSVFSSKFLADANRKPSPVIKQEVRETQDGNPTSVARQMLEEAMAGVDRDSSKLNAVMKELYNVWRLDPGSKTLVFSHYLGFLDMLSAKLRSEGVPCYRFDGSLSAKERFEVLNSFSSHQPTLEMDTKQVGPAKGVVLLMSMTAGAEGLNLMAASSCFIVEPWWNSAKEDQCTNRIHRIGQTAPIVRVRKFIVNDSVEEKIMNMQRCKKGIADELYNDSGEGDMSGTRLSLDDFKLIFRGGK